MFRSFFFKVFKSVMYEPNSFLSNDPVVVNYCVVICFLDN